ncbi:hypothetical protein [Bradyrhizobium sp. 1]|uniref:hypothetical protein n=1 Tax=Bradyrhizobium sp. 1 TaxID=241591 RepID=UPI001FFAAC76|nr:hypothetical protein [Bradyrhizobium sp. 1]MCK1391476.1 hypothetical protein [Bradyrhizobium sp. 1]
MFTVNFSVFRREARMRFLAQEMLVLYVEPAKEARLSYKDMENISSVLEKGYGEAREGVMLQAASSGGGDEAWIQRHLGATIDVMARAIEERRSYLLQRPAKFLESALAECRNDAASKFCHDCKFDDSCCGIVLPGHFDRAMQPTCTQSLFALTQAAVAFTEELYKKYLPDIEFDVVLAVRFETSTPPLSGETTFVEGESDSKSRGASISIGLPILEINPYTYFSIAYVLAHELAVHVVQEWLRGQQPKPPRSWVAFAEGLVDHVIWQELTSALRKRKFFPSTALSFRAIPQIRRFHSQRDELAEESGAQGCWSADVGLGRSAYETLFMIGQYVVGGLFSHLSRSKVADAKFWTHETVLALNVASLSEVERQDVIELLGIVRDQYAIEDVLDWPDLKSAYWSKDLLGRTLECLLDVRQGSDPFSVNPLIELAKSECGVRME